MFKQKKERGLLNESPEGRQSLLKVETFLTSVREVERLTQARTPDNVEMKRAITLKQRLSVLTGLDECEIQDSKVMKTKLGVLKEIALILADEVELLSQIQTLDLGQGLDLSQGIDLTEEMRKFERYFIQAALKRTWGHQTHAAELLGIKLTTLSYKMRRHGISVDDIGSTPTLGDDNASRTHRAPL